ncbi:hypothetical protein HanIR_Chr06g0259011 [Helianthus annuus]|nr:hypothetical protein HanIR_Chr06g0259011 [Helianthus annuus]
MGPHLVKRLGFHMKSTNQIKYLLSNHHQRPPYSKIRTSAAVDNQSSKLLSDPQQEYDSFFEELRAKQRAMEDAATERRDRNMRELHALVEASFAKRISDIDKLTTQVEAIERDFNRGCAIVLVSTAVGTLTGCYYAWSSLTQKEP